MFGCPRPARCFSGLTWGFAFVFDFGSCSCSCSRCCSCCWVILSEAKDPREGCSTRAASAFSASSRFALRCLQFPQPLSCQQHVVHRRCNRKCENLIQQYLSNHPYRLRLVHLRQQCKEHRGNLECCVDLPKDSRTKISESHCV